MAKEDKIELEGTVVKALPGAKFDVELTVGEGENTATQKVICILSGRLRQNHIRILVGDKVTINLSPYDLTQGIIVWRDK